MHISSDDLRAIIREGDLRNYVRLQAGLRIHAPTDTDRSKRCPRCLASENQPCTTGRGRIRNDVHEERASTPQTRTNHRPGAWPPKGTS